LDDPNIFNPVSTPDSSTTYIVTATDANGCVASDTMRVYVFPDISFPNGFSPNGDGLNDTWIIDLIDMFPNCTVEIYNRWGQLLFLSNGYLVPWDGTYNNQPVPVGTYYYIINLNHPLYPDAFTGPLTVLR
jgi:gliding motility-associated-like protein